MKIDITLDGRKSAQKYLLITYVFQNLTESKLVLDFPTWSPGSYLIREYQSQVEAIKLVDLKGKGIPFEKTNKHQWTFTGIKTRSVKLTYKVYANVLNVRGLYADHEFFYLNPCAALFHVSKQTNLKASLNIVVSPKWKVALSKKTKKGLYYFKDFDELYDTPAIAARELITKNFKTNNTQYKMAFWGTCHNDLDKIVSDTKKIVSKQNTLFKDNPCSLYLFIVIFSRQILGGGLEHANSSVNIFDGTALAQKKKYKNFLSLLSHEHFHLWNIKRFRPIGLGPYDYTQEIYTKDLWFVEGTTSYYDDHALFRAGLYSTTEYLKVLSNSITKLESYKATKTHSLSEASFDTWIKHYRPTENTLNTATNYYLKGSLIMMALDFLIIEQTQGKKTLDDVMLALYKNYKKNPEKQLSRQDFIKIAEKETRIPLKNFIKKHIDGTYNMNWKNEFRKMGIVLNTKKDTSQGFLGVILTEKDNRIYIQNITEDSPAFVSDIQAGDEIIAIDRQAITNPKDIDYYLKKKKLTVLYSRRGQISETTIELTHKGPQMFSLSPMKKTTRLQKKLRDCFLRK